MSTAFRPKDFEASIKIYSKNKIYILNGLCCNKIEINDLNKKKSKLIKIVFLFLCIFSIIWIMFLFFIRQHVSSMNDLIVC